MLTALNAVTTPRLTAFISLRFSVCYPHRGTIIHSQLIKSRLRFKKGTREIALKDHRLCVAQCQQLCRCMSIRARHARWLFHSLSVHSHPMSFLFDGDVLPYRKHNLKVSIWNFKTGRMNCAELANPKAVRLHCDCILWQYCRLKLLDGEQFSVQSQFRVRLKSPKLLKDAPSRWDRALQP